MTRDRLASKVYWDKWIQYSIDAIADRIEECKIPPGNPSYFPQYVFGLVRHYWELMFYRYSRGDAIQELAQYFAPMLDAWEESNRLHLEFRTIEELKERRDWSTNLDHYIVCFWLVGFALTLEIPEAEWQRLLALIGNEGQDILLDRIIATRTPSRPIGEKLCHPKPYQRLLKAIDAPVKEQPDLLFTFVDKWYPELDRKGTRKIPAMYARPYWYTFGNDNIEGGAYFGRWCVEAVAAVKAFGLDDRLCLDHPHYPGDLLRPEASPIQALSQNQSALSNTQIAPQKASWLKRWLGRF